MTGVTRSLTRKDMSPAAGWKLPSFFTNILHNVQNVRENEHHVPRCRRRIGPIIQTTAWLRTDRVRPDNDAWSCRNQRQAPFTGVCRYQVE